MTERITADATELMRQASMTAHDYLLRAVEDVQRIVGKPDPQIIAALVIAASVDMAGAVVAQQVRAGLDAVADALRDT